MLESPGDSDVHEQQNSSKRENSSGSFPSNVSRHASLGLCTRKCLYVWQLFSHSLHGSKENSSGQSCAKNLLEFQSFNTIRWVISMSVWIVHMELNVVLLHRLQSSKFLKQVFLQLVDPAVASLRKKKCSTKVATYG
ncbi:hypothetical protein CDL15_Pgr014663 [Punica granatum]|uniref:Uncharacterized protein n=1 Tax=Punica granatum TaxID=22663 RepID=A0A218Y0P0_PUNGR|nr:hypothetical protein CDL15_Pgr014663 [Punica granatum]